jgi:hypothetical protein
MPTRTVFDQNRLASRPQWPANAAATSGARRCLEAMIDLLLVVVARALLRTGLHN